jgi:hypothetical protein
LQLTIYFSKNGEITQSFYEAYFQIWSWLEQDLLAEAEIGAEPMLTRKSSELEGG